MINWKVSSILVSIFLAGGIAGGVVGMRIGCSSAKQYQHGPRDGKDVQRRPVEEWSKRFQKELVSRVGITPEQQTKLEPLIQQTQTDLRQLREQSFQKAGEITQKFDQDVLVLLTEEQKPKFEELIKERKERLKKMEIERLHLPRSGPPPEQLPGTGPGVPPPPAANDQPPPPPPAADGAGRSP